jgi:hypothetical protein
MESERGVVFVREARVGAMRVKPAVECFDEARALACPFVKGAYKKWRIQLCKPLPPLMPWRRKSICAASQPRRYFVQ